MAGGVECPTGSHTILFLKPVSGHNLLEAYFFENRFLIKSYFFSKDTSCLLTFSVALSKRPSKLK